MSVTTRSRDEMLWGATRAQALITLAYLTGAAALAVEGAVHIQQYVTILHAVRWIGPLFLANGAACAATLVGLAFRPTRQLAALGGVVISALVLGGLVVSYGQTLFGWHEAGFRTPIALAVITAVVATIALTLALFVAIARPRETIGQSGLYG
jgi:peptidoglycan/LPS O-acetylase OafA/YrhL